MGDDKTPEEQRFWTRMFNRAAKWGATCAEAVAEADAALDLERKKAVHVTGGEDGLL